jgi:hypothetical protein
MYISGRKIRTCQMYWFYRGVCFCLIYILRSVEFDWYLFLCIICSKKCMYGWGMRTDFLNWLHEISLSYSRKAQICQFRLWNVEQGQWRIMIVLVLFYLVIQTNWLSTWFESSTNMKQTKKRMLMWFNLTQNVINLELSYRDI